MSLQCRPTQNNALCLLKKLNKNKSIVVCSFHEQNWQADCPRYVEDCFELFNEKTQANKFLQYLNKKHLFTVNQPSQD